MDDGRENLKPVSQQHDRSKITSSEQTCTKSDPDTINESEGTRRLDQTKSLLNTAKRHAGSITNVAGGAWETAQQPGETQNRLLALARTVIGLLLLTTYLNTAIVTAVLASTYPPVGQAVSKMMDDMVNGLLGGLPAWNRYLQVLLVLVVVCCSPNFPFLSLIGNVLASKLSMELTFKNYAKETKIQLSSSLEESM